MIFFSCFLQALGYMSHLFVSSIFSMISYFCLLCYLIILLLRSRGNTFMLIFFFFYFHLYSSYVYFLLSFSLMTFSFFFLRIAATKLCIVFQNSVSYNITYHQLLSEVCSSLYTSSLQHIRFWYSVKWNFSYNFKSNSVPSPYMLSSTQFSMLSFGQDLILRNKPFHPFFDVLPPFLPSLHLNLLSLIACLFDVIFLNSDS